MFNGLPLYEDVIADGQCGMLRISLVDLPAVESDFQKFGKPILVQMESEEKRLILGVVMRANFPIYRRDENGEYYTSFSADTIRTMTEKYLEENRQNRVNLMHEGEEVRGVSMTQLFIKDSSKGIVPQGFENIEDGSLFAEFHIHDDDIWGWIKEGILRGFSLEGLFVMKEADNSINENMKKTFEKIKETLAKIVSKFTQVTTDKGVLTYEGELEVGKDVYMLHEDGEVTDVEDGEYVAEDGRVIVVADSKVAEVREPEAEKEPAQNEEENPPQIADDVDIHNLAAEVERQRKELDHKKEEIAELKNRVSALEKKLDGVNEAMSKIVPKPATEEIKGQVKTTEPNALLSKHQSFLSKLSEVARK